ncbi:hypothetical protein B0H19DRAFT_1077274 [Mycena capillaripes]|nr:hypothetical protein B0H19DRAFT_1077274 [Mycena capillaripes]
MFSSTHMGFPHGMIHLWKPDTRLSWNKHWNAYMTHRNLPRWLLQQEFHVHFISTSQNASVADQFREFKGAVEETHTNPVVVEDESGDAACFCIYVNAVSGTQKDKATDEGYHALFKAGVPRTKDFILQELQKQVKLACSGAVRSVKDLQTETGVKDAYIDMRKNPNLTVEEITSELTQWTAENEVEIYSPFLTTKGFDPTTKDTPIELLHTILLGVVKYIWHVFHTAWSPEQKQTYALRLQSTNTDGLSIHAIRANYIMHYAGSLIGRQFKTIAQTNLFYVRDLVTEDQFKAWRACGELAALMVSLSLLAPMVGENRALSKYGIVGLKDLGDHANKRAEFYDVLISEWWCSANDEKNCLGGPTSPQSNTVFKSNSFSGFSVFTLGRGQKGRPTHLLHTTTAARAVNYGLYLADSKWTGCEWVAGESLEECFVGSWVFFQSPTAENSTMPGRITDILVDHSRTLLVVLEVFQVLSSRDELYGVPVLNIKFKFNVQHDCGTAQCDVSGVRLRMQERVESDQIENFVVHKPLDRFFINCLAFHNTHRLRATLPRDIIAPIPLCFNPQQKHYELAAQLREMQSTRLEKRRAAAAAKQKQFEGDDGENEERPKKKKKGPVRRKVTKAAPGEAMVANRSKRKITRSKKVLATAPESEEDIVSGSSDDSEMEDVLSNLDSEYSGSE